MGLVGGSGAPHRAFPSAAQGRALLAHVAAISQRLRGARFLRPHEALHGSRSGACKSCNCSPTKRETLFTQAKQSSTGSCGRICCSSSVARCWCLFAACASGKLKFETKFERSLLVKEQGNASGEVTEGDRRLPNDPLTVYLYVSLVCAYQPSP